MRRALLALVVLLLVAPAVAQAGTYEVWSCAGPDGKPVPADGWRAEGQGRFSNPSNDCAAGNGLYTALNGEFNQLANTAIMTWHFQVPQSLKIVSYRLWRAARTDPNSMNASPVYWMARQSNQYTGAYVVGPENCPGCGGLGNFSSRFAAANLVSEARLTDVRDLFLNAACGGETGWECQASASPSPDMVSFRMYRAATVLQDDADPVYASPPAGSLTAGGALAGAHGVSFSATDVGGGLHSATIEVDGQPAAVQNLGCDPPWTAVVPCKLAVSPTLTLDTAALPDGPHTARVVIADASGNVAAYGPFSFTTSNSPTSCTATEAPNLSVRFNRRSTISFGGRLIVRGQAPAGTQIRVLSQVKRAGAPQKLARTPLVADAAGRFSYRVPAGPSRTLRFAYRNASEPLYTCSKPLAVNVRAKVSLRAAPRVIRPGRSVRFRGRLRGGHVPAEGKLVELQAFERRRWRNLRNVRTNARGAFSYRYRFSFRARGVTFPVRVRVRPDAGYPWAVGTSNRVRVRVR